MIYYWLVGRHFQSSSRKFGKVEIVKECFMLILTLLLHLRHMYLSIELLPMPAGACTVMIVGILKSLTNQFFLFAGNNISVADGISQNFALQIRIYSKAQGPRS
jgi:hypothetical protein